MTHGARYIVGLTTLASVLAGMPAAAGNLGAGPAVLQPLLLRISGFAGGAPAGITTLGTFTFGVDNQVVTLDLSAVQTLNGPLTEGPAALRDFELYSPNLLIVGDPALLRRFADAPPHTQITLFGYVRSGARRMYVVQMETA